jgi:rhomboid protease GluP
VIPFLLLVIVVAVFVFRTTTPDEREQFLERAAVYARHARVLIAESNQRLAPYDDALRARTPWPFATIALASVTVVVFVGAVFNAGPLSNQDTLLAWGASIGPLTTRGEWWRSVTAMFVHAGFFALVLNVAALVQVGLLLERIVGHWTFAVVYVAAGTMATFINLAARPIDISFGASAAVAGVYGLLLASMGWMAFNRWRSPEEHSEMMPPQNVLHRLVPIAAFFVLSHFSSWFRSSPELVGLALGFVTGLALTKGVSERKPRARNVAIAAAATVAIAIVAGMSLRGIRDARPEIAQVMELEERTATAYEEAVGRFRKGRISAQALVDMIERTIVPELEAGRARVEALDGVPAEHQLLVTGAGEYFRLRDESWRLRAEGLKKTNMRRLQEAERATAASLDALRKVTEAVGTL